MKKIFKTVIARKFRHSEALLKNLEIFVAIQKKLSLTGLLRPLAVTCMLFLALSAFALDKVQVTLSRVYDGDTIEVITEKHKKERIRFIGIDCFETSEINRAYKQAYQNKMTIEEVTAKGIQQKQALIRLLEDNKDKQLYLERHGKDIYKRTLGVIYLDDLNVNKYMLESGNAIEYIYKKK